MKGSVRPRGNRWRVVIPDGTNPATGRRRSRVSMFATEAEAWAHLGAVHLERNTEQIAIDTRTVAKLADIYDQLLRVEPSIRPTLTQRVQPARPLYDVAPIVALLHSSPTLDAYVADRIATALGHHPSELWASWWDDVDADLVEAS